MQVHRAIVIVDPQFQLAANCKLRCIAIDGQGAMDRVQRLEMNAVHVQT